MITKFVLSLIVLLIVLTSASGQVAAEKPSTESKAEQELKAKALLLLTETSQQMRGLKNRENQIAARIALASLMWTDQETSARRLYREAFDILRESSDSIEQNEMDLPTSSRSLFQLRTRLVESLGEHDPVMARDLLRQMKIKNSEDATGDDKETADGKGIESQSDGEAQRLEMKLTADMADRNPEEAVRAVRESLSKEISFDAYSMITKLAPKNPKIASELARELVDKLRKADYKKNHDAIVMATSLIRDEGASVVLADSKKQDQQEKLASLLDRETLRGFIEFIVDASLKKDYGEYLLSNLQGLQELIESVAPVQAARIKQKWAELEKEYPELARQNRFREATESDNVQQMLEAARTAEPEMRDSLYSRAASAAWARGDKVLAIEIATKNISSPGERKRQLAVFHDLAISESMTNEDFAEARKLIAQTGKSDERIRQLLDLADAQAGKNDLKAAVEVLNEVQSLIPAKPRNSSELDFQIRLAEAFVVADPDRSFALLSSTIDQINDLMEATARVANFVSWSAAALKDNEFDIESESGVPGLDALLSQRVKTLATADFARTRNLFDKFQRPEIRLTAYLHLSRVILEPERECTCTCPNPAKKQDKPVEK